MAKPETQAKRRVPLWQQKLQAKLEADPLFFVQHTTIVLHERCFLPSEVKGKKITLRLLVNFSFHTCDRCKGRVG